jgi:hypothetical protein
MDFAPAFADNASKANPFGFSVGVSSSLTSITD